MKPPNPKAKDCVSANGSTPGFCRANIWRTLQKALDDGVDFGTFQEGGKEISTGLQNNAKKPINKTKYDFSFRGPKQKCGEFWRKDRYDKIEDSNDLKFKSGRPYSISLFKSKGAGAAIPTGKYVLLVNAHFEHVKGGAWPTSKFNTFFTETEMKKALPTTYPTLKPGDLALVLFQGDLNRAVNSNELQVWTPTDTKGKNLQNLEHTSPKGPQVGLCGRQHLIVGIFLQLICPVLSRVYYLGRHWSAVIVAAAEAGGRSGGAGG